MKICYFGAYNREYPRNSIIRKGLTIHGAEVIECNIPFACKSRYKYQRLIKEYLSQSSDFDAIIIAEINQFVVPLAKILAKINRVPLIFDIFFSLYESSVRDRKVLSAKEYKAKLLKIQDKIGLYLPDIILADTKAHSQFYHNTFGVAYKKIHVVRVGFDPDIFFPFKTPSQKRKEFIVSFIGSFIPLHGVKYIVEAAKLLEKDKDIRFEIIGDGQTYQQDRKLAEKIKCENIRFIKPMALRKLPIFINRADVCLGIFGNTPKASRVIPNKVYQALGMKKPVITGDSPAVREIFKNREHVLLCPMASSSDIADAIVLLKRNKDLLNHISENGYHLAIDSFTPSHISKKILNIIENY